MSYTAAGYSSHVGVVSKQGDSIVLVGPSAFRTDAPLCLDVDAGLHSAALMAQHIAGAGVAAYDVAFAKQAAHLVKASRPNAAIAQVTPQGAIGLHAGQTHIAATCMGHMPAGFRYVHHSPVSFLQIISLFWMCLCERNCIDVLGFASVRLKKWFQILHFCQCMAQKTDIARLPRLCYFI